MDGPKATESVGVNTALRLWLPGAKVEMWNVAMPPGLTGCGAPSGVVPSRNWMVPSAPWAVPCGLTWATKVTG